MSTTANDDAIRAAIAEQCIRKEPKKANLVYDQDEWERHFEKPWTIPNEDFLRRSTEIEGADGSIYCRSCAKPKKHGKIAAYKLHVTHEDDVMQVHTRGLIHLTCHNCGFDMHHPRKPVRAIEEAASALTHAVDAKTYLEIVRRAEEQKKEAEKRALPRRLEMKEFQKQIIEAIQAGLISKREGHDTLMEIAAQQQRAIESVYTPPIQISPDKWT